MVTREDVWEIKALLSKILEKCDEVHEKFREVHEKFRASLDYLESSVEETGFEDPGINNENQEYNLQLGSEEATNAEPDDSARNRECSERLVITKPSASKIIDCEDADMENGVANEKLQMECAQSIDVESSYWANSKDCSDKAVVSKKHSNSNSHHSLLPPLSIIPSYSVKCIPSHWSYKATMTGIWDPGGIILEAKLLFFGSNNPLSLFSSVSILESTTCVERVMNYMSDELGHWDCVSKVFDKTTDTHWLTQMVIASAKIEGVRFVGMMFDNMPQQDPMAWNDTFEGYAQYSQLREALFWYHERQMDMHILVPWVQSDQNIDRQVWAPCSHGHFTIQSAYKLVDNMQIGEVEQKNWKRLRKTKGIPKWKFLMWLTRNYRLLTNHLKCTRKIAVVTMCLVFSLGPETTLHAIRDCNLANVIWQFLVQPRYDYRFFHLPRHQWIDQNLTKCVWGHSIEMNWSLIFISTIASIWVCIFERSHGPELFLTPSDPLETIMMDIDDGSYSICNKSNLKLGENFSLEGRTKNSNFSLGTQCLLDGKRCLDNVLISKIEHSSEIIEGKTNLENFLSSVEGRKQSCDFSPHYFLPQAFKTTLPVIDRVGLIAAMKTQTIQTKEMIQQLSKKQSQDMTMGVSLLKQKLGHHVVPQSLLLADTKAGTLEPVPLAILDRRLVKFKGKPATQLLIPWTNSFPEEATWGFYHSFKAKFPLYMHKKGLLFPNASRFPCVVGGAYLYAYTTFNELITLLVFVEMILVCHLVVAGVARSRVSLPFGIMGSRLICAALYCGVCLVMTVIINIGAAAELTTTILFTRFFFNLEDKVV